MGAELDQVVNVYRTKLKQIAELWSLLTRHDKYDPFLVRTTEEVQEQVEMSATNFLEQQLTTEEARQRVRNLKQVVDVTRQIVEAKSHHVRTAEQQLEEEQTSRLKEFQRIHKIEDDKVEIEKQLQKTKKKLDVLMEKLTRKCTTHRYLEDFTECLLDHLSFDIQEVKEQAENARLERSVWDRFDVDVLQQVMKFPFDGDKLKSLQASVQQMKESLKNQTRWYEDELQTKLFYSSRSKEMQNKITNLKTILKRIERSGRCEDKDDCKSGRAQSSDDFSTKAMVDGIADIQAKDVEDFLSHQFGIRVMADYSMLRRLKEEIGVVGLAYLVERIRFQETALSGAQKSNRTFKDLEEKKIEMALRTIAMEYRAQDDVFKPRTSHDDELSPTQKSDSFDDVLYMMDSPTQAALIPSPSAYSSNTRNTSIGTVVSAGVAQRQESISSLKSRSSMSRIKKIFKF